MIYSVWNQGKGAFDYFEDAREQASLNAPAPTHLANRTLGSTVDQAGWPLPADARQVGSGGIAVGRVAVHAGSQGLGDTLAGASLTKAGLLAFAAILACKYLVKPRKRTA